MKQNIQGLKILEISVIGPGLHDVSVSVPKSHNGQSLLGNLSNLSNISDLGNLVVFTGVRLSNAKVSVLAMKNISIGSRKPCRTSSKCEDVDCTLLQ